MAAGLAAAAPSAVMGRGPWDWPWPSLREMAVGRLYFQRRAVGLAVALHFPRPPALGLVMILKNNTSGLAFPGAGIQANELGQQARPEIVRH